MAFIFDSLKPVTLSYSAQILSALVVRGDDQNIDLMHSNSASLSIGISARQRQHQSILIALPTAFTCCDDKALSTAFQMEEAHSPTPVF